MRCLVTGGAGFIGSHLIDRLLKDGYNVIVIDNFSTGKAENLTRHRHKKNLRVIKADIFDFNKIVPYFKGVKVVFHIAGLADIVPSIINPLTYYRTNVYGTMVVSEVSRLSRVKKLIYAASSSCYGIADIYPIPETAPIQPQYPYALSKYLREQLKIKLLQGG